MTIEVSKKTAAAVEKSIVKWEANLEFARASEVSNILYGPRDCPLCLLFYGQGCRGCPIAEFSGYPYCEDTPYESVENTIMDINEDGHIVDPKKLAWLTNCCAQEVEFLKQVKDNLVIIEGDK